MKFVINSVSSSSCARIGTLKKFNRMPDLSFDTPMLFLYTKGGCIPHVTLDVLELITKESLAVQLPLPALIPCHQPLTQFQDGIGKFIGMKDCLTYCTVQDSANPIPAGHNVMDKISLWSRSGKEQLDADRLAAGSIISSEVDFSFNKGSCRRSYMLELLLLYAAATESPAPEPCMYMEIMESFRPDIYQCLGDGETNQNSTNKRIQKSINRSLAMFHKCLEKHKNSEVLKKSGFIALLQGGYDINERIKYAKEIAGHSVDGFVIDGLHANGPEVEFLDFEKVKPIITETLKEFSEDKLRIVHGCWNPETVLRMVQLGVDAFDASFPYVVTERGSALSFSYKLSDEFMSNNTTSGTNPVVLDSKQDDDSFEKSCIEEKIYEINLEDKKYAEEFEPLYRGCMCLCCRQHTRAYIHHLLSSKELLAHVLLMIHNLHHYMEFFKSIRRAVKEESLDKLHLIVPQKKME